MFKTSFFLMDGLSVTETRHDSFSVYISDRMMGNRDQWHDGYTMKIFMIPRHVFVSIQPSLHVISLESVYRSRTK